MAAIDCKTAISRRSHEKIGDPEQSHCHLSPGLKIGDYEGHLQICRVGTD